MSDTNPGHVALEIENTYISYWPTGEDSETKDRLKSPPGKGNLKDFKFGFSHNVSFPSNYRTDRRLERKDADSVLIINGLDAEIMCQRWEVFKAKPKRYNMKSYNCSTVVASFLEIGSGVAYGKTPCIKIDHYVVMGSSLVFCQRQKTRLDPNFSNFLTRCKTRTHSSASVRPAILLESPRLPLTFAKTVFLVWHDDAG